jgi:hypothetical protein
VSPHGRVKPGTTDRVRHVNAAGLGGQRMFLSGEACRGVGLILVGCPVPDRRGGNAAVDLAGVSRGRSTSGDRWLGRAERQAERTAV